ncbi:Uncharacterised protein [Mycobacterium tuberculosis]|nr:Uncharacterised protein [Mycobacterium tuberculosis]
MCADTPQTPRRTLSARDREPVIMRTAHRNRVRTEERVQDGEVRR